MNIEGSVAGIYYIVDALEHIHDFNALEKVIESDIKDITQYDQLAYILADKNSLKVFKVININYPVSALELFIDKDNRVKKETFLRWNKNTKSRSLYATSYGSQETEGKYISFFLCFNSKTATKIESRKLLQIIMPRLHSSIVKLYRIEVKNRTNIKRLSPRETEIMLWVANGKTNVEIGMILGISAFTVKNHVSNILEKLNVTNRAEALNKVLTYLM